jgi:tyrosyl-tRNA synthetase
MWRYYELLSRKTGREVEELKRGHPRAAKVELAREIVSRFHGPSAGKAAEEAFEALHARREVPDEIQESTVERDPGADAMPVSKALARAGMVSSGSEGRRLIAQGGVSIEGERVTDPNAAVPAGTYLMKVGKRKFLRITIK